MKKKKTQQFSHQTSNQIRLFESKTLFSLILIASNEKKKTKGKQQSRQIGVKSNRREDSCHVDNNRRGTNELFQS